MNLSRLSELFGGRARRRKAFFASAEHGRMQDLRKCLEQDSNLLQTRNVEGLSVLDIASMNGKTEVVEFLLKKGAEVNAKGYEGATPLHWAIMGENVEIVRLLLAAGADVSAQGDRGVIPLGSAAAMGAVEIALLLLEKGANVNQRAGRAGAGNPLHMAVLAEKKEMAELLLAAGADVNAPSGLGTPLGRLLRMELTPHRSELIELLRRHGGRG